MIRRLGFDQTGLRISGGDVSTGISSTPSNTWTCTAGTVNSTNAVSGPQSVDQNNGWLHLYNSNTGAITTTWAETCRGNNGATPEGNWAADLA